ncbi:MAG: hypothetical protein KDA41_10850 [Planctomycetales bacterium]|nr:hypothetical protein [Planctomycetales bacterium]
MRPLAVVVIWVVTLGGLWLYMQTRSSLLPRPTESAQIAVASGEFAIELTPTFNASGGVDEFSLDVSAQPVVVVALNGQEIVRDKQPAAAGVARKHTWDFAAAPLHAAKNEFQLRAQTPPSDASAHHGLRFRLLRDDATVVDTTVWAPPGQPIEAAIPVALPAIASNSSPPDKE